MAKPNYSFEKRQRELAKKKKKEEKRLRKLEPNSPTESGGDDSAVDQSESGDSGQEPSAGKSDAS